MDNVFSFLENNELTDKSRDILGQSLFYYCSGVDPTPIVAFGAKIPLYVYVDSFCIESGSIPQKIQILYDRLNSRGFKLVKARQLKTLGRFNMANYAELTEWNTISGDSFMLLFVVGDAKESYENIYSESSNYIQPKYVCNYRYETPSLGILKVVEKRAEYILGHCFNSKYRCVEEIDYLGDYGSPSDKLQLYRRHFYYLY
jgi:hypothetical protein